MVEQAMISENGKPVQRIKLGELENGVEAGRRVLDGNIDVIRNVKVRVTVSAGRCELAVKDLLDLRENAVLTLDKTTRDPVDVLIDGKVVARGSLVAVGDHFGVRISEVHTS
jgi:flagellar motor switch protein FliN